MLDFILDLALSIAVLIGVYADIQHGYTAFVIAVLFLAMCRTYGKQHDA